MSPGALLLISGIATLLSLAGARCARAWLTGSVIGAISACSAAVWVLAGGRPWDWKTQLLSGGETVHLRLDALSAFFLALVALIAVSGSVYAQEYWPDARHPRSAASGRAWWTAMVFCMGLVLLSANGLHFLVAWELFAVTGYFLITLDRHRGEVRKAGWLYLAASHAGTLCLFAFFTLLASRTGSWELGPMRNHPELAPLFWLALVGFGVKAGIFPLHIWLPSAHANAPSHVSALLSGVALKMGIYGIIRFSGWLPVPQSAGWTVAALGIISAVLGVAFALGQHDLKRLLAYHSVENIGIILIGLGFALIGMARENPTWAWLALAGGLLHVWNHGVFKSLLFFGAGSVLHSTGTREMSRLGGLWRAMPWTAGCFTLGAAAIAGLPPLNGFVSEWLVYLGLFDAFDSHGSAAWIAIPAVLLLAVTGALALACFVKVIGVVFLGQPRSEIAKRARETSLPMRAPMLLLAAICIAVGLVPGLFLPAVSRVIADWQPAWKGAEIHPPVVALGACNAAFAFVAILASVGLWLRVKRNGLSRAGTWDCGYAQPTARMQYTAGSFAQIITGWFAWVLRPETHEDAVKGNFPLRAAYSEHTPETVLEKFIEPAARVVMFVSTSARRLQHGRVQWYLLYLLLGLLALAIAAFTGSVR